MKLTKKQIIDFIKSIVLTKEELIQLEHYPVLFAENNLNKEIINTQSNLNAEIEMEFSKLEEKYTKLENKYKYLLKNKKLNIAKLKDWYEGNRSKDKWLYDGYRLKKTDVKNYLKVNKEGAEIINQAAIDFIGDYNLTINTKHEVIIETIMKYFSLKKNWTYKYDIDQYGKPEFWQSADKSWLSRKGDCDDLAILINVLHYYILKNLDRQKEHWRLTFTAGMLLGEGGHAFNTFLHNDGEYYVVESTYDLVGSFKRTWLKTPVKNNNTYKSFWGFATCEKSWKGTFSALESYKPNQSLVL